MLEGLFRLREAGTTVRTELLGGLTTFMTMSYIVFVNPAVLSQTGMDFGAVMTATCLSALTTVLTRHPDPAVPLTEADRLLRDDNPFSQPVGPAPRAVRRLDPWRGAWHGMRGNNRRERMEIGAYLGPTAGVWVVAQEEGDTSGEFADRTQRVLRESVLALSREVDGESVVALARWLRILEEGRVARGQIPVPAA